MAGFLEFLKVVFLGIVEGITEWLPISSTGHMLLVDEFIHLDVSKEFKKVPEIFYSLGFTGESNKKAMEPGDTAARYVFDNGYSETSLTKPDDHPFYDYLKGNSGMHCVAVRTPNAVEAAKKLEEKATRSRA